jgi:hypothetical protein
MMRFSENVAVVIIILYERQGKKIKKSSLAGIDNE